VTGDVFCLFQQVCLASVCVRLIPSKLVLTLSATLALQCQRISWKRIKKSIDTAAQHFFSKEKDIYKNISEMQFLANFLQFVHLAE
jgi:hypothetical protein